MTRLFSSAALPLKPLSEDERVVLDDPREIVIRSGERQNWDEISTLRRGERRSIYVDVRVDYNAHGRMIRVFDVPEKASLHVVQRIRVGEGGSWNGVYCVRGRGEVRIRRVLELCGPGAEAHLGCVGQFENYGYFSGGDEIISSAPGTNGTLRTHIVLKDNARSEARGRMVLLKDAAKSEGFQRLDHLMLGDEVKAVGIPELEVHVDDVKCAHGATTSRPSERAMFYLASRGINIRKAEGMLARGFIEEGLMGVPENMKADTLQLLLASYE